MDVQAFLEGYPKVVFGSENDEIFTYFRLLCRGMCSIRLAKLLNFACQFLTKKEECYLEIGTYAGFTLLSAGYESGGRFIGVDDFSENFSIEEDVMSNLDRNLKTFPGDYTVLKNDFRKIDYNQVFPVIASKVGVFLIDGKHTYEDVMDAIYLVKPHFAQEAVIFFDDINVPGVKKAVDEIKKKEDFREVFFADSFYNSAKDLGMSSDKYIHNGFSVMTYTEKGLARA